MNVSAKKPSKLERLEAIVQRDIEAARFELKQAEEQCATWTKRRDELNQYIADRETALKAD